MSAKIVFVHGQHEGGSEIPANLNLCATIGLYFVINQTKCKGSHGHTSVFWGHNGGAIYLHACEHWTISFHRGLVWQGMATCDRIEQNGALM